jgi:hypothetical protein
VEQNPSGDGEEVEEDVEDEESKGEAIDSEVIEGGEESDRGGGGRRGKRGRGEKKEVVEMEESVAEASDEHAPEIDTRREGLGAEGVVEVVISLKITKTVIGEKGLRERREERRPRGGLLKGNRI